MSYEYRNIPMEFDVVGFARNAIYEIDTYIKPNSGLTDAEIGVLSLNIAEYIVPLLRGIVKGSATCMKTQTDCVSINVFLEVCNALGLDPRRYFLLAE